MRYAEIEAELDHLSPDELRRLALKSWTAFVEKERGPGTTHECDEDDSELLAALDQALARADTAAATAWSGSEVRARIEKWTSK